MSEINKIKEYWNKRAKETTEEFDRIFPLGYGGTYNDIKLQHLEMNAILKYIKEGETVLDIGCGKGYPALYIVWKKNINLFGIDYAEDMISEAKGNLEKIKDKIKGNADFSLGDIMRPETLPNKQFDMIFTERCLINITNWEEQKKAIENISNLIKQDGLFLMLEGSKTSIDKLNEVRMRFGLEPIKVVWHNLFFEDEKLIEYASQFFELIKIDNFASTYLLISRVLNPALIKPEEPKYNAKINELALKLPNLGEYSYQKLYVFKKK